MKSWPQWRDVILFLFGIGGVTHETLSGVPERPTLLLLFAACMGLPLFLRADERGSNGGRQRNDDDGS